jgi:hypothetical protein
VVNNTIYQPGGDGVQIAASLSGTQFYNNIDWVDAGTALKVGSGQSGFVSNYNLFYTPIAGAQVGVWNGVQETTLAAWQAASGEDANSANANPKFLNPAGADNILGGTNGFDDNFDLAGGSPAINAGDEYLAPITDIDGNPRHTDPGTPDTGIGEPVYVPAVQSGSSFSISSSDTSLNYQTSGGAVLYTLPFNFTFYGVTYSQVYISTSGFLQFAGPDSPYSAAANSPAAMANDVRMAPFWSPNLTTSGSTTSGLYVNATVADQVTIRWAAFIQGSGTSDPVNFSVTLFSNGTFRFDYGVCTAGVVSPTVGVSSGNGILEAIAPSTYNGASNLSNADSLLWTAPTSLTTDIGAYEYQGNSDDLTAPDITSITNLPPNGGSTPYAFTSVQINFSDTLEQISAASPTNFVLVYAPGGVLGAPDNAQVAVTPEYSFGQSYVTLEFVNGVLPSGLYQLTVQGVYDINGNLMAARWPISMS